MLTAEPARLFGVLDFTTCMTEQSRRTFVPESQTAGLPREDIAPLTMLFYGSNVRINQLNPLLMRFLSL